MIGLQDKTALITGAGSGIGRATSLSFVDAGVRVLLTDINEAGLEETAAAIRSKGGQVATVRQDVADEAQWVDALKVASDSFGGLHILVNCAGIFQESDTFSTSLDVFQKVMAVNAQGTFLGMKHAIPMIAEAGGGAVVNISSVCGIVGVPRSAVYCASKAAIRLMSKAVALECAQLKNKVRVNSIHPGLVDTPQSHDLAVRYGIEGGVAGVAAAMVPLGEACTTGDVAQLILYLSSDAGRHITGAEMVIDGGISAA